MDYDYTLLERVTAFEFSDLANSTALNTSVDFLRRKKESLWKLPDLGRCLENNKLFAPAVTLFEGILGAQILGDEIIEEDFHLRCHKFYGHFLFNIAYDPYVSAQRMGIPLDKLDFQLQPTGELLFDGKLYEKPFERPDFPLVKHKCLVLSLYHLKLSDIPHNFETCSYKNLIGNK